MLADLESRIEATQERIALLYIQLEGRFDPEMEQTLRLEETCLASLKKQLADAILALPQPQSITTLAASLERAEELLKKVGG